MAVVQIPAIDFTSRDQPAIKQDMIRAIPLFTPEWTDFNDSDFGIVLVTVFSGAMDVIHFYVDRAAGEMFLPTAVKRESVVKILKLINFELRSIVPASVDVKFTLVQTLPNAVLIPAGTKVQTIAFEQGEPVVYETATDVTIPSGNTEATVSVIEGESKTEPLGTSTGQAFQSFPILATIIVEGSLLLFVDEGSGPELWVSVVTFVDSGPADKHYRVERDADEAIEIFFGDNLQGKIPAPTAVITSSFSVIQGDRGGPEVFGNVGAGTITIVQGPVFAAGTRVTLDVTNEKQASGGEDRQSIEEAKRLGPASLRALNRAVTSEDYKTLIEQQGGIAKTKVIQGIGTDPCCACNLDVFVAPTGGGVLSTTAKDALLLFLDAVKMVGTCVVIKDPTFIDIDIEGTVFVVSSVDEVTTKDLVNAAVDTFFDLEGEFADFGRDVFLGNLFAQLENVGGVDHVDLETATRRPVAVFAIQSGDSTIGSVTVDEGTQDETWTIVFTSQTEFTVQATVNGLQTNTGTVGTPYTSDQGEVTFEITPGVVPNEPGDQATFVTSKKLGNVPIDPTEIMQEGFVTLSFIVLSETAAGTVC